MRPVEAPATVGNFGPGFDAFSLALHGIGDRVELRESDRDRVVVEGPHADGVPATWRGNVAGAVVDALRARTRDEARYEVRIHKRLARGSGLGSSASSAGGTALAYHARRRRGRLTPEDLVRAAADGEARAAGRHYDDVAAVVQGGLSIVHATAGTLRLARVQPPARLRVAVLRPHLELPTRQMRRLLPQRVPRADAVHQIALASQLVDAFHRGDVATAGACLDDRIATPRRKVKWPHYDSARAAALAAGAAGVCASGSGPAMVALCTSDRAARGVADAMKDAAERHRLASDAFTARPEPEVMHRVV